MTAPSAALPPDERVRALAAEILSRDEYARHRVDEAAWRELFERIDAWLRGLAEAFAALANASPAAAALVLAGLIALAALLVVHAVWSVRVALRASAPERVAPRREPAPDLAGEARALAAAGRHLDAARLLQLACLRLLVERGELELARSDPNRTLRRRVARAPLSEALRRELLAGIDALEARLFRDGRGDAGLVARWDRLHAALAPGRGAA